MRHDLAVVPPMSKHSRRSSPRRRGEPAAGQRAGRRAGLDEADRRTGGVVGGHDAAVRQHHQHRAAEALAGQPLLQLVEVRADHRHRRRVARGGDHPRVLADLRRDLRRDAHRHAELAAQVLGDDALVGRVGVGVEQAHADRLDARRRAAASASASRSLGGWARRRPRPAGRCARRSRTRARAAPAAPGTRSAGRTCRSGARCGSAACRRSPAVVTTPARPILPSISALVMSVVACTIGAVMSAGRTPALASSWRTPVRTPSSGADGVVSVLSTTTGPDAASSSTTSVNVPPMSTASRQSAVTSRPGLRGRLGSRGGANTSRIHTSPYSSSPMKMLSPCHTSVGAGRRRRRRAPCGSGRRRRRCGSRACRA